MLAQAVAPEEPLAVTKIDPPNWFSTLPEPMLLVRGTGFARAKFSLSDPTLKIRNTTISENGHWAILRLSASPAKPETVTLSVVKNGHQLRVPYGFKAPRPANDGMQGFTPRDVIYLIMTDRFADGDHNNDGPAAHSAFASPDATAERALPRGWHGGDLRGVLQHLDYLQQLGITTVWLTPVYANAGRGSYHGYSATDQYAVDPHFGSLADLQDLAKALRARGMKLMLDTVPNHVGPRHPWVLDEPAPNWFHGTLEHHIPMSYDFFPLIDPHAPERDRDPILHGWFANTLPDMNTDDATVAQYLRQNTVWWVEETGADALRIDTFAFVNRGFWNGFHAELHQLFPRLTDVGEVFDPHPEITSSFAGGVTRDGIDTGLYTPFDFPTYFVTREVFGNGKSMSLLAQVLASDALYPHPERLVPFLGNHDTIRFATAVPDPDTRRLAVAYLLTTRGTPQIYAGDEIAMEGGKDPANREDFPGGFEAGGFEAGPGHGAFRESMRTPEQQAMWSWFHQLLRLRAEHAPLACGTEQILDAGQNDLVYLRIGTSACPAADRGSFEDADLIVLQRGARPLTIELKTTAAEGCRLSAPVLGQAIFEQQDNRLTITPSTDVVVLPCRLERP
ncbi:MAG TPA: alpha-amylase family glycosyl hydrolase [Acidobacteriaceae bacterium]|nr:alpha-amylase family glycosyl hydrolase [Acidobacteriaceae bacterium]